MDVIDIAVIRDTTNQWIKGSINKMALELALEDFYRSEGLNQILRTEGVVCRTDSEAPRGKFVILGCINKIELT